MIVVDVETSGLNPWRSSILSIGALDFHNPSNTFYAECRVWEGAEVSPEALAINGFTEDSIHDPAKPSLEQLMARFIEWVRPITDQTLAGVNPFFDRDFLKASAYRYRYDWGPGRRIVDLHSLCYAHQLSRGITPPTEQGRTSINADTTFAYVGLPAQPTPHHAMTDVKLEAESFSRLIHGRQLLEEFHQYSLPPYLTMLKTTQKD